MINKYLIGIDGSTQSMRALKFAAETIKDNAHFILAYVIEWSPYGFNTPQENEQRHQQHDQELEKAHRQILDPATAYLQEFPAEYSKIVEFGHAAKTLLQLAKKYQASQIFIGRHGHSRLKDSIFGCVTTALVKISTLPVTIVP